MLSRISILFVIGFITVVSVFAQQPLTDCSGQTQGTSCDTDYCMEQQTCDGMGTCQGGTPKDCTYVAVGHDACTYGVCDSLQKRCRMAVYPVETPCDKDRNYCTQEFCNSVGECIDYHQTVQCPTGQVCFPSTGTCGSPLSPSSSASKTSSATVSISMSHTNPPSRSPGASGSPTRTRQPRPSTSPTPSPTNFVHVSSYPHKHDNATYTASPSVEPLPDNKGNSSSTNQGDKFSSSKWIPLSAGLICLFLMCCICCIAIGASCRAHHFDGAFAKMTRCFRRKESQLQDYDMTNNNDPDDEHRLVPTAEESDFTTHTDSNDDPESATQTPRFSVGLGAASAAAAAAYSSSSSSSSSTHQTSGNDEMIEDDDNNSQPPASSMMAIPLDQDE